MRLVSYRSHVRCALVSPILAGFGYVAVAEDVPLWLRSASAAMVLWGGVQLLQYLLSVRRWHRHGDRLELPTFRHPDRTLTVDPNTTPTIVEFGFTRMLHVGPAYEEGTPRLAINMFVARSDLVRWARGC